MCKCGECKVCCTVLPIDEISKPTGIVCQHYCDGCTIHDTKPKVCKDFNCAYLEASDIISVNLRPDKCGVMFFKKNKNIFSGIINKDIGMTAVAKNQIASFNRQGYSVILLSKDEQPHIILAEGHTAPEIYKEYIGLLNGNI